MIKSYIVKNEHAPKTIAWAQKQRFMGRWMPESHDFYELFLGEYPNSSAYEETRPDADRWIHPNDRYKELPNPVMLTNDDYLNCHGAG